jgi:ferredoxin--NADP+ reductase
VVILGRRGPAQAAFTTPELIALADLSDVDVVIDSRNAVDPDQVLSSGSFGFAGRLKAGLVAELASREPRPGRKRIVLRFLASPTEVLGTAKVTGVRTTRNALVNDGERVRAVATDEAATIDTSLVLSSIGYRGRPVAGVPFDERSATIPNLAGRVLDGVDGRPVPGVYTTGWIKRGPSGVIGTNKQCSDETVQALLVDYYAGLLDEPVGDRAAFHALLDARVETRVDVRGWRAIDTHEREAGAPHGRPRVKMSTRGELLKVALTERN